MTAPTTSSPGLPPSSASARVPILLTVLLWPAVICLVIFSPSFLDDLIGVPAIFVLYALMLVGYALVVEARDLGAHHALVRVRQKHLHLIHPRPPHVSGP